MEKELPRFICGLCGSITTNKNSVTHIFHQDMWKWICKKCQPCYGVDVATSTERSKEYFAAEATKQIILGKEKIKAKLKKDPNYDPWDDAMALLHPDFD